MDTHISNSTAPPILVTGGTGVLGRLVVAHLWDAGRPVRVLSRGSHPDEPGVQHVTGDLEADEGIDAAMTGVEVVIHCAGSSKGDDEKARSLVRAASAAGVRHLVNISVVGADRIPAASGMDGAMFGYFGRKHLAEQIIAESGVPWTTLRATQFHDLILTVAGYLMKLPVVPAPSGFRFQPVDAAEVAARLMELALDRPAGLVREMAGPKTYGFDELLRAYLRAAGKHRLIVPLWMPGKGARAFRAGAATTSDGDLGRRTWEDFLVERVGSPGTRHSVPA